MHLFAWEGDPYGGICPAEVWALGRKGLVLAVLQQGSWWWTQNTPQVSVTSDKEWLRLYMESLFHVKSTTFKTHVQLTSICPQHNDSAGGRVTIWHHLIGFVSLESSNSVNRCVDQERAWGRRAGRCFAWHRVPRAGRQISFRFVAVCGLGPLRSLQQREHVWLAEVKETTWREVERQMSGSVTLKTLIKLISR